MSASSTLSPQHRRLALEQLSRERLTRLTEHFGLEPGDRRVAANHVEALVRARSVDFADLLRLLKREELQAICEALQLESGGREKDVLVQRILGMGAFEAPAEPESPQPADASAPPKREEAPPRANVIPFPGTATAYKVELPAALWAAGGNESPLSTGTGVEPSPKQIGERGRALLSKLPTDVQNHNRGRFAAVNVDTGDVFFADSDVEAARLARAKDANARIYLGRIGANASYDLSTP